VTSNPPPAWLIHIEDSGETYVCLPEQNLLKAMERLGRRGIPVGCRGGGCGVCKVRVLEGSYTARKMSREQVSEHEQQNNIGLACRMFPTSDMRLQVLGHIRKVLTRTADGCSERKP
jgi:ferredoxin